MDDLERSGFFEFDQLMALVRRTRELLDTFLGEGALPRGGADYLAEATLPHLEGVQAGFRGALRTSDAGLAELQYLILQAGIARSDSTRTLAERRAALAEAMLERAIAQRQRHVLHEADPWDLVALFHARLVMASLPHLPSEAVRYPAGRRTYADIPAPRGPAELVERIEELERELWRAATGRPPAPTDPALRRTYGFFDAAERLGWRAFGVAG